MNLWLDDMRPPPDHTWWWFDNAKAVIDTLSQLKHGPHSVLGYVSTISLDHDLGDETIYGNGYQVIAWIEEKVFKDDTYIPPIIQIHTSNPVAIQKMKAGYSSILRMLAQRAK